MKKVKEITESIGIDVSKATLDVFIHTKQLHKQFLNNKKGFVELLKWVAKEKVNVEETIWCFEHTGWYCILLSHFMYSNKFYYCCVNPMEIKRSMGLKRSKTDKQDAQEIARYAWLRRNELESSIPMPLNLVDLQRLVSLREQLVKQTTALKNLCKGFKVTVEKESTDFGMKTIKQTLKQLESQIKKVEKEMTQLIKQDGDMYHNFKMSKSVKGVGDVMAIQMLLHTHNYSRFGTWREFSSYCGLVPYPYQSGTSINRKPTTHSISDQKMKSLLTMSAISAIQADKELKQYFKKRVEEGKPKMVVLNIIRNKIVSRIFATVKRGTPYVEMYKFAA
jgi:transposase